MGEDMQYKHALGRVVHPGNQSVVVAVDVEHGSPARDVCMREVSSNLSQGTPVGSLRNPVPVHQRDQRIRVPSRKLEDGWFADNPHN